jgi:hypothetical protein
MAIHGLDCAESSASIGNRDSGFESRSSRVDTTVLY